MSGNAVFLREQDVAKITGFALPTLRNWRFARRGPRYRKVGRSVRYELSDVISFMDTHKIETQNTEE